MVPSISSQLLPRLAVSFAGKALRLDPGGAPVAVFASIHPEVGNVEIFDDGDELTVVLGRFTHSHFANYDEGIDEAERGKRITEALVEFLNDLFEDRIELYGNHNGAGGARRLERGQRGLLSKAIFGGESYVWSGPLKNDG